MTLTERIKDIEKSLNPIDVMTYFDYRFMYIQNGAAWYLSPFRTEHKPSFRVNIARALFYDFGTGEGGDMFKFIMKQSNCGLNKAVEIAKNLIRSGIDIAIISKSTGLSKDELGKIQEQL